jgi:hypothetical protein
MHHEQSSEAGVINTSRTLYSVLFSIAASCVEVSETFHCASHVGLVPGNRKLTVFFSFCFRLNGQPKLFTVIGGLSSTLPGQLRNRIFSGVFAFDEWISAVHLGISFCSISLVAFGQTWEGHRVFFSSFDKSLTGYRRIQDLEYIYYSG